ncbi:MAG: hypothetical protein AB2825_12360, partial [Candidatus Thiodiazotropha endolucinida]
KKDNLVHNQTKPGGSIFNANPGSVLNANQQVTVFEPVLPIWKPLFVIGILHESIEYLLKRSTFFCGILHIAWI